MNKRIETESRKDELLEAAGNLFLENGYRDTSINSIVEAVGVSKGTFYYYFDSKEDVVDGIVEKISKPIYQKIDDIIANDSVTAVEKLNEIFSTWMQMELEETEILRKVFSMVYKPENLRLRDKIQKEAVEKTAFKLTEVIEQGVEEGTFETRFPEEVSYLVLWMGMGLEEEMAYEVLFEKESTGMDIHLGFRAYEDAIERVLGAPEGSIQLVEEEGLREFISFLEKDRE